MAPSATTARAPAWRASPSEDLERLTQRRFAVLVAFHERLGVQCSAERARLTPFPGQLNVLGGPAPPPARAAHGGRRGSRQRASATGGTRIQAAVAGHAEQDNLHAIRFAFGTVATRTESALGAISQGGDARRPLTHCDSYRLPGMLLLAYRSRVLRAIGFS